METKKVRGAAIRSRVKWQNVDDKCSTKLFKTVRQNNTQAIISKLWDKQRSFTKKEDLEKICLDFYKNIYQHKEYIGRCT